MKRYTYIFIALMLFSSVFAEEFTIHKYEAALKTLESQQDKALKALEVKVNKSRQSILEKYYNDLERHFNHHMKGRNIELANKVNNKKEKIFTLYKDAQEASKPKPAVAAKADNKKLIFLGQSNLDKYSTSYENELKDLKIGNFCFKKGGNYEGEETWKRIPDYLKGKKFTFMKHEKDSPSARSGFRAKRDGYVYIVTTSNRSGYQKVDTISTSGGRVFKVYKYYMYDGGYVSGYCSSTSNSSTLIVINK